MNFKTRCFNNMNTIFLVMLSVTLHLNINKVLSEKEVLYMNIEIKNNEPNIMYVQADGKLDLKTAVEYGRKIKDAVEDSDNDIKELILDFSQITFISSLGLKIILDLHNFTQSKGCILKLKSVSDILMNAFKTVCFDNFLNFE